MNIFHRNENVRIHVSSINTAQIENLHCLLGHRRNMSTPLPGILPFLSSPSLLGTLPRTHSNHNKPVNIRSKLILFSSIFSFLFYSSAPIIYLSILFYSTDLLYSILFCCVTLIVFRYFKWH